VGSRARNKKRGVITHLACDGRCLREGTPMGSNSSTGDWRSDRSTTKEIALSRDLLRPGRWIAIEKRAPCSKPRSKRTLAACARPNRDSSQNAKRRFGAWVDANIIGIFIWDFEGRIIEANDAFLRMVGYDREDLVSGSAYAGRT